MESISPSKWAGDSCTSTTHTRRIGQASNSSHCLRRPNSGIRGSGSKGRSSSSNALPRTPPPSCTTASPASSLYGKPSKGSIQFRARPESWPAPYCIDTGKIPANDTKMTAFEAYYRPGPVLLGTEYFLVDVNSPQKGNPLLHGGDAVVTWLPTGE